MDRMKLSSRCLGHLTAVYCVLYDKTGQYIFTGADDKLVKVWSAVDGRLLATLRGATAEITDMGVNLENSLLAVGSNDGLVRVWSLRDCSSLAVLNEQFGQITSVFFCPMPNARSPTRYLASTATDGSCAFWAYTEQPGKDAEFQGSPTIYEEKIRPGPAHMLCASFSSGGVFMATGSVDRNVRVYYMLGAEGPQRILNFESHKEKVDSISWAHHGLRFISGSTDGTAVVYRFECQEWRYIRIHCCKPLSGKAPRVVKEDRKKPLPRVTMVAWNTDDSLVFTATSDFLVKAWNSSSGNIACVLKGHTDEIFVIESHPFEPKIVCTAGHDGLISMWKIHAEDTKPDAYEVEQIFSFRNHVEGQGNGSVFDCKLSPDGLGFAATDALGHLLIFGTEDKKDSKFSKIPSEMFFHTDYRPFVSFPTNPAVIDEQTQTPTHLMPHPFLVNADGNPHPPEIQRLVPGREKLTQTTATGQSGQSFVTQKDVIVPPLSPDALQALEEQRLKDTDEEEEYYQLHLKKAPTGGNFKTAEPGELNMEEHEGVARPNPPQTEITYRRRYPRRLVRSSNAAAPGSHQPPAHQPRRVRYDVRSLLQQHGRESDPENFDIIPSSTDSDSTVEEMSESSSSETSDENEFDSDRQSRNGERESESKEKRSRRHPSSSPNRTSGSGTNKRKRKEDNRIESDSDDSVPRTEPSSGGVKGEVKTEPGTARGAKSEKKRVVADFGGVEDIPEAYLPPDWLSEVMPKRSPYFPQVGDDLVYFRQGHELYVKEVETRKIYEVSKKMNKLLPFNQVPDLPAEISVRVVNIKFELVPPRVVVLTLERTDWEMGGSIGVSFTVRYHDMPSVVDFFVLRQVYDKSVRHRWKAGDRFRCMVDRTCWLGTVSRKEAFSQDFPHSNFLCYWIKWDGDDQDDEQLSPWDMEIIAVDFDDECRRISTLVTRVMDLSVAQPFLTSVDLSAFPDYAFQIEYPIDLNTIKARLDNLFYRRTQAILTDIEHIAINAEKFHEPGSNIVRSAKIINSLLREIVNNDNLNERTVSEAYHRLAEQYSQSPQAAPKKSKVFKSVVRSTDRPSPDDPSGGSVPCPSSEESHNSLTSRLGKRVPNVKSRQRCLSDSGESSIPWQRRCKDLLLLVWGKSDALHFRHPVDTVKYPDYISVVETPMCLSSVKENLNGSNYESPHEFNRDMLLIFENSRRYNTDPRAAIRLMTSRLKQFYQAYVKKILTDYDSKRND